jgi:hypothetical protein
MQSLGLYSQHFILLVTYEFNQYATVLYYIRLERLASYKNTLAYWAMFPRKRSVANMVVPLLIFTLLHFLCNLRMT